MAAAIVADDAKHLGERLHLRLPHLQGAAQRVRQHQRRSAVAAFHGDVEKAAVGVDHGHGGILVMRLGRANGTAADSAQACDIPAYRAIPAGCRKSTANHASHVACASLRERPAPAGSFLWPTRTLLRGKSNVIQEALMAMTMTGEVQLAAPRQAVWDKLNDPDV